MKSIPNESHVFRNKEKRALMQISIVIKNGNISLSLCFYIYIFYDDDYFIISIVFNDKYNEN